MKVCFLLVVLLDDYLEGTITATWGGLLDEVIKGTEG